jgi:hypothetical protein
MKHDDILFENMDKYQYVDFAKKNENYSELEFRAKERPNDSWAIPLVTGHQYRIKWGTRGINFEGMTMTMSPRWKTDDLPIEFTHQFTDVRAKIAVRVNGRNWANNTLPVDWRTGLPGQNIVINNTDPKWYEE